MEIISKIEINYFRSVYGITAPQCRDLNVFVGSNDAGKSNILKALNLFFKNETEPHQTYDFLRDLNRNREEEARAAKGRMSIWVKIHFNNFLKWRSLPEKFWIKRSWNRYEENPTDSFPETVPSTTVYRFLNKLEYHYIPAVRGREIFSDLLAQLHDTLLGDESLGLRGSSQDLVDDLQRITSDMSEQIANRLGIQSKIEIPESLKELFRALDFSTKHGGFNIPLNLRGDGIQSRHLPFILDYIANKSKKYHIWGYEEPENSLELSRAYEMAQDFSERFSKENQIFLTTHSPAFYDLDSRRSARWYVENEFWEGDNSSYTDIRPINAVSEVDETMGLLSVIAPRMRAANEELSALKSSIKAMTDALELVNQPTVYVEGPSDVKILTRASEIFGINDQIRFISADGASNITQFLKVISRSKEDERPILGLYDADQTGRKEFEKFNSYHFVADTSFRAINRPSNIFVGTLHTPDHLTEAQIEFQKLGATLPLCIEFIFAPEIIEQAVHAGVLNLEHRRSKLSLNELPLEVNVEDILRGKIPDNFLYLGRKVADGSKTTFSDWVIAQPDANFDVFEALFVSLGEIIGQ